MKDNQRFELNAPTIDERDFESLIEKFNSKVASYAPEWTFSRHNPDFGSALAIMFLHLLEGNISRLNKVPYKSLITFLNHFNVERAPATSAISYGQFKLTDGAPEEVLLEQGTQVSATDINTGNPVVFETANTTLLTPAKLQQIIAVYPKQDRIVSHVEDERWQTAVVAHDLEGDASHVSTTMLYGHDGINMQEHTFYLEHPYLFDITHASSIEILLEHPMQELALMESIQLLTDSSLVSWEYFSSGQWVAFDAVHGIEDRIRLLKLRALPIEPYQLNTKNSYFIRCRAFSLSADKNSMGLAKVQFQRMRLKTDYAKANEQSGLSPHYAFNNDIPIKTGEGCLPFGDFFTPYGCFYFANDEVLNKRGADVSVTFDLSYLTHRLFPDKPKQINWKPVMKREVLDKVDVPDSVTITKVQWEYWNGRSWSVLECTEAATTLFQVVWEGEHQQQINFEVPEDIETIEVNGQESMWIRGRIINMANPYSIDAVYYSPYIQNFKLVYAYDSHKRLPQNLSCYNNLEWKDYAAELQTGGVTIRPFKALSGYQPTVWFGFDRAPERGPIQLYFDLISKQWTAAEIAIVEWEYLKGVGTSAQWAPLVVSDETQGFSRSGTIAFVGPRDFAYSMQLGKQQYWIRAINRNTALYSKNEQEYEPLVQSIYLNTVKLLQQHTITNEKPIFIDGYDTTLDETASYFLLANRPVLSERVWVDETSRLSSHELEQLKKHHSQRLELVLDSEDNIMQIWVEYENVEHFMYSEPNDRHYSIDRATGKLMFGSGRHGMALAVNGNDQVKVSYISGGGKLGNVAKGTITSLQTAIAFIESVTNIHDAAGGCDAGTISDAILQGTKFFSHRGRTIVAEDYEWITKSSHPNVAKVKCLPNINNRLEKEIGAMTIVVLPHTGHNQAAHFIELKRIVEQKLLKATASSFASPSRLQVIEPVYVEIGVRATVWVKHMDEVVIVEREIQKKLTEYLHPITGNHDGRGWEIGQRIHHSMFFSLMKSVGPVVHIPQLLLESYRIELGKRVECNPDKLHLLPNSIIMSGQHRITVDVH